MGTAARAASDPGIALRLATSDDVVVAYQARTRVLGVTESDPAGASLRARIANSPRARALLSHRLPDGTIPLNPYAKFQGPHWTLVCLAQIDYPPGDPCLIPVKRQMDGYLSDRAHLKPPRTTAYPDQPERVRRCASQEGNAIWSALRLGLEDERTAEWVDRLVAVQWPDGGWNCDKRLAARTSSFQETAIPARALHAYAVRFGHPGARRAADRAAELLLSRRLLWRRHDGAVIRPDWGPPADRIQYPIRFYDVLAVLEIMAEMGRLDDPRCVDALDLLEAKRLPDGGFPLEERVGFTRPIVASRATFADWGPSGTTRSNPLVTVAALGVLRRAGRLPQPALARPASSPACRRPGPGT